MAELLPGAGGSRLVSPWVGQCPPRSCSALHHATLGESPPPEQENKIARSSPEASETELQPHWAGETGSGQGAGATPAALMAGKSGWGLLGWEPLADIAPWPIYLPDSNLALPRDEPRQPRAPIPHSARLPVPGCGISHLSSLQ